MKEAILRLVKDAQMIDDKPVSAAVARPFRGSRTADVRAAIDAAIDALLGDSLRTRNGTGLTVQDVLLR